MRIFIGSSTNSLNDLELIASWLRDKTDIESWKNTDFFLPGHDTWSSLVEIANSVDAAVFIFGEDDQVGDAAGSRMQPRDNVLVEYGLFSGILGVWRTAICRKGSAKVPSDLHGIGVVDISPGNTDAARTKLRKWVDGVRNRMSPIDPVKGRVVLLTKSTRGFTGELRKCIETEFQRRFPTAELKIVDPAQEEYIQQGDFARALDFRPEVIMMTPSPRSECIISDTIWALERGIPIITVDDRLDADPFIKRGLLPPVNIACDYEDGGVKAADAVLDRLHGSGTVAIISGPKRSYSSQIRKNAFVERILEKAPNLSIVAVKETDWNPLQGEVRMNEILSEYKQLDALFCCNDLLALKAIKAIKQKPGVRDKPPIVVGHDGIREGLAAVAKGEMCATISQHMDQLALLAVRELEAVLADKRSYMDKHALSRSLATALIT